MNKYLIIVFCLVLSYVAQAQCSICTKTAEQLGEGPAKDLNAGILYLALTPFVIAAVIGYTWYYRQRRN